MIRPWFLFERMPFCSKQKCPLEFLAIAVVVSGGGNAGGLTWGFFVCYFWQKLCFCLAPTGPTLIDLALCSHMQTQKDNLVEKQECINGNN